MSTTTDTADATYAPATVLIVDDDEGVRLSVAAILRARQYRTLLAADGAEAVALFREQQAAIDAVILDLSMPGLSGREVLAQIRAIRPDVPVIIASGYAPEPLPDDPRLRFIQKSLGPKALQRQLDVLLRP
jgi:CheY-like chemotaxis protein